MRKEGFVKDVTCRGIEYTEKCPRGLVPKISKSNALFWSFFRRINVSLYNGMGGFQTGHIKGLLSDYGVPEGQKPVFYDKLFIVLECINDAHRKRLKSGKRT